MHFFIIVKMDKPNFYHQFPEKSLIVFTDV